MNYTGILSLFTLIVLDNDLCLEVWSMPYHHLFLVAGNQLLVQANVDDTDYIDKLIGRGDQLVIDGLQVLRNFREQNNYFTKALEDALGRLINDLSKLKAVRNSWRSNDSSAQAFLHQIEQQVTQNENNMLEITSLGHASGTDPSYKPLLDLMASLVNRAYNSVSFLVMHGLENDATNLRRSVREIEDLVGQLRATDWKKIPPGRRLW